MKRYLALLMCIAMVLCSAAEAFAAAPTATTNITLTQADGTVTVRNASGKEQKTKDNMKLYNGFTVATSEKSYAYIDLGDLKYVKLDASTEAEVKMSGKKLEVLLKSGQIFFDVDEKLKNDESLKIRTSKSSTNIRGTAGTISEAEVFLVNGVVETEYTASGAIFEVPAGSKLETSGEAGAPAVETIENLAEEMAGFAAVEVANNEGLAEKVAETFGEEAVAETAAGAEEKLAEDEQQAEEEAKAEEAAAEEKKPGLAVLDTDEDGNATLADDAESTADYTATVAEEAAAEAAAYYYEPVVATSTDIDRVTLAVPNDIIVDDGNGNSITIAAFRLASTDGNAVQNANVITADKDSTVKVEAEIYYDGCSYFVEADWSEWTEASAPEEGVAGKYVYTREISLSEDLKLDIYSVNFYSFAEDALKKLANILKDDCIGGVIIQSPATAAGINIGDIVVREDQTLGFEAAFSVVASSLHCEGHIMTMNKAVLTVNGDTYLNSEMAMFRSDVTLNGKLTNATDSALSIDGNLTIQSGKEFINNGQIELGSSYDSIFTNNGTLNNYGSFNVYNGSCIINMGTVTNESGASFTNSGRIVNNSGATFTNSGTYENTSGAQFINDGGTVSNGLVTDGGFSS